MGFAELLGTIGGMGNFQILQTALMFVLGMLLACEIFMHNFAAVVPEHHCRLQNQTSTESPFLGDGRDRDLLKVFIPMDKGGKPEKCLRFTDPQWQLLNPNATEQASLDTEGCLDGWVYDKNVFSSIINEWDLVCEQKTLVSLAMAISLGGQQTGNFVLGMLADRFGRRTVLLWASMMTTIAGTCAAFMPTFAGYIIFTFLKGAALGGITLSRSCLSLEWTPTEKRILVNICNACAFSLGQILLSGCAYLLREWRWLQFSTSVSFGIIFLFALALPESACWLITHNKLHLAVKTLQKVAWLNGQKEEGSKLTPEVVLSYIQEDLTTVKSRSSLRDFFQTTAMCKMTLCIIFLWFACGFSTYGLGLDLQRYGFSIYLVQLLFGFIDIPARLLAAIFMSYLGNRFTCIFCTIFSGCMIITSMFVPQDMAALIMTLRMLAKGIMGSMFLCLQVYTLELYPTEIRQGGMSLGVLGARLGALLVPSVFIVGSHVPILQPLLFGGVPVLSAIAANFLIETHGLELLETIQGTENRMKRAQSLTRNSKQDAQERPALLISERQQAESTV